MSIPTTIESLSTTAASNGPSGSDQRTLADDGLRQGFAFIKQLKSLATIASASTITPPSTANAFSITGTTTINTIASTNSWDGRDVWFIFAGALTLTHSSNLALPGSANITTAANDAAVFIQTAAGAWRCVAYRLADGSIPGTAFVPSGSTVPTNGLYLKAANNPALASNSTLRWDVNSTGNHTVAAPSSGITLTVGDPGSGTTTAVFGTVGGDHRVKFNSSTPYAIQLSGNAAGNYYVGPSDTTTTPGVGFSNSAGSTRFTMTDDGRLFGNAIHNNAGAVTGTTNQYIASGTYTPTMTGVTGITGAPTSDVFQWIRIGNVVTVSGRIASVVYASAPNEVGISFPIASNIASTTQCAGFGVIDPTGGVSSVSSAIIGDATNDRASMKSSNGAATAGVAVSFTYLIV